MATLIWSKVRNIRVGDTSVPFEIKYDDGSSLVETTYGAGYSLAQAVNGEGGVELCLSELGWSLNRGQPDYDWQQFWSIASENSNDVDYDGAGNIGFLSIEYGNGGMKSIGYGSMVSPSKYFEADEYFSLGGNIAPLQPYWNIENESCYVDIPLVTKEGENDWYQDEEGLWKLKVRPYTTMPQYDAVHENLGDLGAYHESATWHNDTPSNSPIDVPLEDITNQILYGLELKLVRNRNSTIDFISASTAPYTGKVSFVPISITQEAPDYNFNVDISSINNLPTTVLNGESADGSFSITSNQFNGSVSVYILNSQEDINNINAALSTNFGEDDAVNYGQITLESSSYSIAEGETIDVPVTYISDGINVNQTDSYTIIVVPSSINQSAYGEFAFEASEQFENQLSSDLMSFSDIPTISIINSDETIVDEYSPSSSLINKPSDIIFHILEQELGYNKNISLKSIEQSRIQHNSWNLGFSVTKEIESKELIKQISQSSKLVPTLSNDLLRFVDIKSTYRGGTEYYNNDSGVLEDVSTINSKDVIKYNFSRTKIKDVITKIELQYDYDYGTDKYKKTKTLSVNEQTYWLTTNYGNYKANNNILTDNNFYTNYYGLETQGNGESNNRILNHTLSTKKIKNKYLSANYPEAIDQFLEYNLMMQMNQHNIVELTLPLKYYNLEVGDLIEFDDMILGNKVYGEKYVLDNEDDMPIRCGQYILPLFIVNETNKSLNNLKIKATQLHHLTYQPLEYKGTIYNELDLDSDVLPSDTLIGDVNSDGLVDILDLVAIINGIVDNSAWSLPPQQAAIYDYNQDGFVNILDIVAMVQDIIDG